MKKLIILLIILLVASLALNVYLLYSQNNVEQVEVEEGMRHVRDRIFFSARSINKLQNEWTTMNDLEKVKEIEYAINLLLDADNEFSRIKATFYPLKRTDSMLQNMEEKLIEGNMIDCYDDVLMIHSYLTDLSDFFDENDLAKYSIEEIRELWDQNQ